MNMDKTLPKLWEYVDKICPYKVGDIFLTTNATNPSTVWLGTTWQKIEGRMLKGTSGTGASKATGGSDTVKLAVGNLPSHTHSASQSAHTHTQASHYHIGGYGRGASYSYGRGRYGGETSGSSQTSTQTSGSMSLKYPYTSSSGGDTTGSATPAISVGSTGSGSAFSILSAYYTVHMWLRLS